MPKLLKLNLQFFAEEGGSADAAADTVETQSEATNPVDTSWIDALYADDEKTEIVENDNMIPKKRFDSVNSKYKELTKSNKTMSDEYETLKGTHKELEANHKAATERIAALEGVLSGMVAAELENIDESYHDLIPQDRTVEQKLDWIIKAKQKGMFRGGQGSYEYEIGGMSNPSKGTKQARNTSGLNPLQMMTMGYGGR